MNRRAARSASSRRSRSTRRSRSSSDSRCAAACAAACAWTLARSSAAAKAWAASKSASARRSSSCRDASRYSRAEFKRSRKPGLAARVSASSSRAPDSSQSSWRALSSQRPRGLLDDVGGLQVSGLLPQPAGQRIPLAQQAFQRDLDNHLTVALIFDQQPLGHQRVDEPVAVGGQVEPLGGPPQRLIIGGVDGRQPGDKGVV